MNFFFWSLSLPYFAHSHASNVNNSPPSWLHPIALDNVLPQFVYPDEAVCILFTHHPCFLQKHLSVNVEDELWSSWGNWMLLIKLVVISRHLTMTEHIASSPSLSRVTVSGHAPPPPLVWHVFLLSLLVARSSRTQSIHLLLGLALAHLPSTSIPSVLLVTLSSSLLCTWPYQQSLCSCIILCTPVTLTLLLMSSFSMWSSLVWPHAHWSIFISATSILFS